MSLFANAPVVAEKPKGKTAKTKVYTEAKDVELYAAICAVEKSVKATKEVIASGIKSVALEKFIAEGIRTGKQPESLDVIENGSTASLQFKCRGGNSPLSDEEVELLTEYNIPVTEVVSREETFIINPAYADLSDAANAAMLDKVSEALEALGLPADFIMKQSKTSKKVADEASIAAVCQLKKKGKPDEAAIAALMPVVGTQAIRAALKSGANAFEIMDAHSNSVKLQDAKAAA